MGKKLYFFNRKTLQYEMVKPSIKNRLMRVLSVVFTGVLFAGLVILIAFNFFNSPKELMQQREIEQFKLQTQILNEKLNRLEKVADNLQDRDDNIYRIIFEAEPVAKEIRRAGVGGSDRYEKLKGYKNSDILINTASKLDQLSNRLYVQSTSYDEVYEMAKNMDQMTACIPAIQPISDKYKRRVSSYYGYRIHPIYKRRIFHDGLDFSAPVGTEVYAAADGVVVSASRSSYGYGNKITINHGYGYKTVYAHLHYEVIRNNRKVNPIYYFFNDLSPQEYEEIISSANSSNAGIAF